MYIIENKDDLNVLGESKVISDEYFTHISDYFNHLYSNLAEKGITIDNFTLKDSGYIVLLERGDNLRNLSIVGLETNGGLIKSTPEFINTIKTSEGLIYEIVIVYNNEFCMTFYVPSNILDDDMMKWIHEDC